jgi:hypothetical protein
MSKFTRLNLKSPSGEEVNLMSGHVSETADDRHYQIRFDNSTVGNDLPDHITQPHDLLGWTCVIGTKGMDLPDVIPERGVLTIQGSGQKVRNWTDYWILTVPKHNGPLVP